jgi:hypothetical protein
MPKATNSPGALNVKAWELQKQLVDLLGMCGESLMGTMLYVQEERQTTRGEDLQVAEAVPSP